MSQEPSSKPLTSSPAAGTEANFSAIAPTPRFIQAVAQVAALGIYGAVWLDDDLNAQECFGPLVNFIKPGRPITDSVLALIGLEDEIRALRADPGRLLELPAVATPAADGPSIRLNFTFCAPKGASSILMLAYRANSQTELELELSRQIRARLMAEAEVMAKSKELARANVDLGSFAAVVSHDLKSPLRHMRQIADDVITNAQPYGQRDVEKLRRLQELSRRMSHMLTELLDYASLGRKSEALAETDTQQLIDNIVSSMPASAIRIGVEGTWPKLVTLAAPLDLVLRNLLQNALQHHDRPDGEVILRCTETPAALMITVHDDGRGIATEHHGAIFLPFRTLENGAEASGTGMGLAMVKKVLTTLGGEISVESNPAVERGTTFNVTWPKCPVT